MAITKDNSASKTDIFSDMIKKANSSVEGKQKALADYIRSGRINNFDSEILNEYSNMLATISEEIVKRVENSTNKIKQQFDILLKLYDSGEVANTNYFDNNILENYYSSENRITYNARCDYEDSLSDQKLDPKMMVGLIKHVYSAGDYCHSGYGTYVITPLGYHIARTMYLKKAASEDIYTGDIEKDFKKVYETILKLYALCNEEIKLFYEPRESVLNTVNKILENMGSSIKKDIDNTDFKHNFYDKLFDINNQRIDIQNLKFKIKRDAIKIGEDSKAGKYLSAFSNSVGKLYNDINTNEKLSQYINTYYEARGMIRKDPE
jgi:hypothetical protein